MKQSRFLVSAGLAVLSAAPVRAEAPPPARPAVPVSICGEASLVGTTLPPIVAEGRCGLAEPVRLAAAAGIALDPPAVLDCDTARALGIWLEAAPKPAFAERGDDLQGLIVADAYSCRNRNRAAQGKLSEHALGHAIDISGFRLADGVTVTVRDGWDAPELGPLLHRLHAAACGPFSTVLGPEANAFHVDHLHLDTEARRSGPYCE